ncbi:MAG: sugar transferase [Bacillota bacterium]|nr:sugar transferase [Bacillota bacterium]
MKDNNKSKFYEKYIKRKLDFIFALLALILFSPVLIFIAFLVRFKLGSPVLFKQQRPGLNEEIFTLYKFRTMTAECDENGELLSDEKRLTPFGKKLRASSLDELPELINILKGDMAIIGPRPLLVKYLPLYNERQKKRHLVRPGITGYAQVNGRNSIDWETRFELDVQYVENMSLGMDIGVFFKTIEVVMKRDGINSENNATMEDFQGTPGSIGEERE